MSGRSRARRTLTALCVALLLAGCGSKLRVVDATGMPISGATVIVSSLTISSPLTTDGNGFVSVPSRLSIQGVRWLDVRCPGYQGQHLDVSMGVPTAITLRR